MKRVFDIVTSGLGLIFLSPLFAVLAVWIKADSKGPVFYHQTREWRDNKDFRLFKFRSMRPDSDKLGLITVGGHDPHVTRSGYYIRKFKLDEFPQLINVFKGDMSLVGPRPEVRKYVEMYTPEQMRVLSVRPGISPWHLSDTGTRMIFLPLLTIPIVVTLNKSCLTNSPLTLNTSTEQRYGMISS